MCCLWHVHYNLKFRIMPTLLTMEEAPMGKEHRRICELSEMFYSLGWTAGTLHCLYNLSKLTQ